MTLPRDLRLEEIDNKYYLVSQPVKELDILNVSDLKLENFDAHNFDLTPKTGKISGPISLYFSSDNIEDFSVTLSNSNNEKVVIGYNKKTNNYYIDRTSSGKVSFEKNFAAKLKASRISKSRNMDMILVIDKASVEMFADNGLTNMTAIFFPDQPFSTIVFNSDNFKIKNMQFHKMKSIWE